MRERRSLSRLHRISRTTLRKGLDRHRKRGLKQLRKTKIGRKS